MLLPLLVVFGAAAGSWPAAKMLQTALVGGELLKGKNAEKRAQRLEREDHLGMSSSRAQFEADRKKSIVKAMGGDPQAVQPSTSFTKVEITQQMLPAGQKHRAGVYYLTERELCELDDAVTHGLTSVDFNWLKEVSRRRLADQALAPKTR